MGTAPDAQRIAKAVERAEARVVNLHNASLAGCRIDGPLFRIGGRSYPIDKVSAEMELGASTSSSRITATRLVAGAAIAGIPGMLVGGAAKKTTDTSRIYLTIRTPDGKVEVRDVPTSQEKSARRFMANLEMATNRKWPLTSSVGTILPLDSSSVRSDSQTNIIVGTIAFGLLLLILGFVTHILLVVFGLYVVAACTGLYIFAKRDKEALDHYRRSKGES
ncbi:hypothetical protein [Nocardia gipuzkoensis]